MKKQTIMGTIMVFALLLLSTSFAQEDLLSMVVEEEILEENEAIQEIVEEPVELQEIIVVEEPIKTAPVPIITGKVVNPEPKNVEEAFLAAILEQLTPAEQKKVKARLKNFEDKDPLEYIMERAKQLS